MTKIPLVDLQAQYIAYKDEFDAALARCLTGLIPHLYRGRLSGEVWLDGLCTSEARVLLPQPDGPAMNTGAPGRAASETGASPEPFCG